MKKLTSLLATVVALAGAFGATSAFAVSTWEWKDSSKPTAVGATKTAISGTDPALTSLSGVFATNGTNNAGFASGANWQSGPLTGYPGLGMSTGADSGSPTHAMDNNGNTEAIVVGFGSSVALTSIGLSYTSNNLCKNPNKPTDAAAACGGVYTTLFEEGGGTANPSIKVDLSVWAWTGGGAPTVVGANSATMTGWTLVGNYGEVVADNSNPYNLINSSAVSSSWWLISAYNSAWGSAANLDVGNDYFKISALAGYASTPSPVTVPEPASLALVAIGLIGIAGVRSRSSKKAAAAV